MKNVIMPNEQNESSELRKYLLDLRFLHNNAFTQRKRMLYVLISLLLGIYFTLVSYPGGLNADSYTRWNQAYTMVQMIYHFDFSGKKPVKTLIPPIITPTEKTYDVPSSAPDYSLKPKESTSDVPSSTPDYSRKTVDKNSWHNITPQFFMALLYAFTYNVAAFTLVQAIFFFLSTFLMIDKFVYHNKTLVIVLFIICPLFYHYSVAHEMAVGCVIGINFCLLLLFDDKLTNFKCWSVIAKIFYVVGLFTCCYIAFGFRPNAFTICPIIITVSIYLYKKYKDKMLLTLQIGCVCIGLFFVNIFPTILGITILNSSSPGFVWEILSVIQEMPEEKQNQYNEYLDFIAGEGCTIDALAVNSKSSSVNPWLWDIMGMSRIGNKTVRKKITQKYLHLAFAEPNYFFRMKLYFVGRILGIQEPVYGAAYDYNLADQMQLIGMVDNPLRYWFVQSYIKFQGITIVFHRPWIWFCIGLMLVIWQLIKTDKEHSTGSLILYLLSVFYYAAFLINTQSFEFRYFFPSFYFLFIVIADSVTTIWYQLFLRQSNICLNQLKGLRDGECEKRRSSS